MKKQYIILGLLVASFQFATAQFTLDGEFRPRAELFGNGQSSTAAEGAIPWIQTSVRAAINATYTTDSYKMYLGFQEVFLYGDRQQIAASGNGNFRVQEAWVDLKLADKWSFKLGRQPLSYDDQRILGGLGWAQQARTHDVGILKYYGKDFALDAGYSLNTNGGNVFNNATLFTYRELAFVHANKKFGKFSLSGLLLNTVYQTEAAPVKSNLLTAGIHAKLSLGAFNLAGNFYIQDGERIGETAVKGATLFGIDATFKATEKVTFLAGFESIGGKEDDSAAFFPLYGTNHKFNGLIDRFYVGNHGNAGGLVDLNIGGKFKLPKGYSLTAKFHNFTEQSLDKAALGNELDLVLAKGFKGYKIVGGYSHFFEPDTVTGAGDTQNWAWMMLIIKPKFLTGTK